MKSLGLHGKVIVLCRSRTEQNMWGCLHVSAPDMVRAIQQFNRRRKVGEGKGFCDSNVPWPSPIKNWKMYHFFRVFKYIHIYIYSDSVHISQWETSKYDKQMDMNWMIYSRSIFNHILFIYSKYDKIWIGKHHRKARSWTCNWDAQPPLERCHSFRRGFGHEVPANRKVVPSGWKILVTRC